MDVKNPSFEIPGPNYGQAQDWTEAQDAAAEDIGLFNCYGREVPFEGYEQDWQNNQLSQYAFGISDLVYGLFENGTEQAETYNTSWCRPQVGPVDPTNPTWNHHSIYAFGVGNLVIGSFDTAPENFEDYEEGWDDCEDSVWMGAGGVLWAATTGGSALSVLAGQTLLCSVNGGAVQTAIFLTDLQGAADIAVALTALLSGASGVAPDNDHLGLQSDTATTGTIEVTGGTANGVLNFPLGSPAARSIGDFDVGVPEEAEDYEEEWQTNEDAAWMSPGGVLWAQAPTASLLVLTGETLQIEVNGAPATTITFLAGASGSAAVAVAITALLVTGRGVAPDSGHLGIQSGTAATGTITVVGGTANARLLFPVAEPTQGSAGSFDVGVPEAFEDYEEEWTTVLP